MQNHEIMTLKQLAEYLKVSPRSIYKLVKEGTIPTFKIMNRWRFERSKIDQWIHGKCEFNNFSKKREVEHGKSIDN